MFRAVVLAAGLSRRMGENNKLLLPWGNRTVIEHILQVATKTANMETVVVTGSQEVGEKAAKLGVAVYIPQGEPSQSNSLKTGIAGLAKETKGVFFLLGDQPFIDTDLLAKMQRSFCYLQKVGSSRNIVVPFYREQRGNPVLFSTAYLDSFAAIEGDQGARNILQANRQHIFMLKLENPFMLIDIDTPDDYRQALSISLAIPKSSF